MTGNSFSPELANVDLEKFMREALLEAEAAAQAGELPIGAVLVLDGEIISRDRARHKETKSQLSHAELNALLNGGEKLWTDYKRAILFTTVDIPHIIFAKHDQVIHSKL